MIIARSPLRITLGGGGTDLPSYYRQYGGFLVSAAIDKYIYVAISRPFLEGIILKYSQIEKISEVDEIRHPIIREALRLMGHKTPQIEITSIADVPAGTGLGSSSTFTTALLKGLYTHRKRVINQEDLARMACHIEMDILGEPIGKQDQYISSYGGLTCFAFNEDDSVDVRPLNIPMETLFDLEDNLLLFFTGFSRNASDILREQNDQSKARNECILENLHIVKDLGLRSKKALEDGKPDLFGEIMHEHWENKKKRSGGMSNPIIDEWYELGRKNGAIGGKLVGAGGGGFLMFYAENKSRLQKAMHKAGLENMRFKFDFNGAQC